MVMRISITGRKFLITHRMICKSFFFYVTQRSPIEMKNVTCTLCHIWYSPMSEAKMRLSFNLDAISLANEGQKR